MTPSVMHTIFSRVNGHILLPWLTGSTQQLPLTPTGGKEKWGRVHDCDQKINPLITMAALFSVLAPNEPTFAHYADNSFCEGRKIKSPICGYEKHKNTVCFIFSVGKKM